MNTQVGSNTNVPTKARARAWMLTINNPTDDDKKMLMTGPEQYAIWQIEEGKEKTQHIQAFVYYKNPVLFPKKRYPRAHIEKARSIENSIKYCCKEDTRKEGPWERGERPMQGKRSDLDFIAERIKEGVTLADLAIDHSAAFIRYHKGFTALKAAITEPRKEKPIVTWLWGLAGTGKTRYVHDNHTDIYIKDGTMWWDGYTQNEVICIDDFDGRWPFRDLLRLLDRYAYRGQVKGGYTEINSKYIYITCEYPPSGYWKDNEFDQVNRRLDEVKEIKKKRDKFDIDIDINELT